MLIPHLGGTPRSLGEMGVPILTQYFNAVVLEQIKYWWSLPEGVIWASLEAAELPLANPKLTLVAARAGLTPTKSPYPAVQASLQVWQNSILEKAHNLNSSSVQIPIDTLRLYIPDINLTEWKRQDIKHISDIISRTGDLLTFLSLYTRFKLGPREQYRYAQISHLWRKTQLPATSFLYKPLLQHLQGDPRAKKGISVCYNFLSTTPSPPPSDDPVGRRSCAS